MYNCSNDVLAHHDEKVTLPTKEQDEMRERRDANRKRLKKGLDKQDKPAPLEHRSQGSYAMKTMVQHSQKDYDIDDGVYFDKEDLVGDRGAYLSALDARKMVRDALNDGPFNNAPECRRNCVRVYYNAGYHVDVPVYRRITTEGFIKNHHYELASSEWKRSDARDVTKWFSDENRDQSPDTTNGRQLRRVVRQIKKFARSRPSWSGQILSGFGITKLVTECYKPDAAREDRALHDTMQAMRNRLNGSLVVGHPVTPGETITKGNDDATARFLRERLSEALVDLAPLFESDCTRAKALKCWDKVFKTDFFSLRESKKTQDASPGARGFLSAGLAIDEGKQAAEAVRKEGGGRYG
ncbi:cyclic GMP-AMP synthase DncV-like nucleotidyltransferase [Pseudohoeflea coraliihabitans]|uniref:Cyclic GMP-AMP synthase n=1 Tax=Pseudohoeflea coraliihabitans TaxID=2860393 RepID=A0ABS6WSA7_9HYPH|nr:hypothetical protein [Pseudohoeflea sp. DP4N28-3]MBW3098815.1 hypothetical protein [Pseudohoeflea sp. DP4N28-3]